MGNNVTSNLLSRDEQKLLLILYYDIKHLMNKFSIPFNEQQQYNINDLSNALRLSKSEIKRDIFSYVISQLELNKAAQDVIMKEVYPAISGSERAKLCRCLLSLSVSLQAENLIVTDIPKQPDRNGHLEPIDKREGYLDNDRIKVSFTKKGFDLSKEYSGVWGYIRLWYNAYIRNHPIIITAGFIVVFILGIVSTIVTQIILKWLTNSTP
jgi:hypothetical protein